ncbi:MAG TPA: hypothetical protein VGG64_20295 [Pirellulales bacterium]|jgi:hypothetical protein
MIRPSSSRAKWFVSLVAGAMCVAGALLASPANVAAQAGSAKSRATRVPAAAKPKPGKPVQTAPAGKVDPSQAAEFSAAREEILHSEDWQQMIAQFHKWLDTQKMYDASQVKQIKARLEVGIKRMTAIQLQRFLAGMHEKLDTLSGQRAIDAEAYLTETLSVASPVYARKIRQQLPDVLSMTAAQVDQKLASFAVKQQSSAQLQKSFNAARQQQIAITEAKRASQQEQLRASQRVESNASTPQPNNFTPAIDYYPIIPGGNFDTGSGGYAGMTWTLSGSRF